ncbi:hypothetical protein HUT16_04705 [Kitasatospora sp. NA04385]|uniref:hypothetical protein n=1 Tax=Kitasatospora sp. NA04385 TaxID=2742135 RepID=UPI00159072D4|nr:hypothetical protein [Kitasatospora sp. NA04385]QKW18459.1 hypothetical protein HUT16_04705 [Kitasatospora sp. NA04385]
MPDTAQQEQEQGPRRAQSIDGLRSIWAAGEQPQPVLPWYRKVTRRQVGVTAACLVTVLAAALAIRSVDSGVVQHRVALPTDFAGLTRVADAQDLATLRASYENRNARRYVPRIVQVQGYGQPGATGLWESELVAVAMQGSVPDAARAATEMLGGYSPDGGSLRDGTPVGGMRTYPPGPLNGALACATLGEPGEEYAACAWADGSTLGALVDRTGELTPEELADRTRALRSLTELPE